MSKRPPAEDAEQPLWGGRGARLQLHAPPWGARARLACGALVCLYAAARLWRLTQYNLGRDEIFGLETARRGWHELLAAVAADAVHPPLFYLLLKTWVAVGGESLRWLKLFPALTAILGVVPLLLLCREMRLRAFEVNVALSLVAVNAYLVTYAHELRMYSLLLLLSLTALWLFVRLMNAPQIVRLHLFALLAAHVLLIYTHYYGWLLVAAELSFVLWWRRDRAGVFAAVAALCALSFAPWALAVARSLGARSVGLGAQLEWHARPGATSVAAFYALLNGPFSFPHSTALGLLIAGLVILLAGRDLSRGAGAQARSARPIFGFLLVLAVLPVAAALLVSLSFSKSVWHPRYLIASAVPYLLLVALSLARVRPGLLRRALTLLVVTWAAVSGTSEMRRADAKVAWDVLARDMSRAETARSAPIRVYMLDDFPRYPMGFHLNAGGDGRFDFVRVGAADLTTLSDAHCWIVYGEGSWPAEPAPPELLRARGYEAGAALTSGPRGHGYVLFPVWRR